MLRLLREGNPDFDRNVIITLIGWLVITALGVLATRRLLALDGLAREARGGRWPEAGQLRSSRAPEWAAALCVLAVCAAHFETIASARALFPKLPPPQLAPGELASRLSQSLSWQLNSLAMTNLSLPLVGFSGLLAIVVAVSARARADGLQAAARLARTGNDAAAAASLAHQGRNPLVAISVAVVVPAVLTLLPVWHGVHQFVTRCLMALGKVSNLPPGSDRAAFMAEASVEYRSWIEPTLTVASFGALVGAALGFVVLIRFGSSQGKAAVHEPSSASTWLLVAAMLVAAAVLVQRTLPMREENRLPWPKPSPHETALTLKITTPSLEPADPFPGVGPLVTIDRDALVLDGRPVDLPQLERDLATLKRNWQILHPDEPFVGYCFVACSAETPSARIADALQAAQRTGYTQAWFTFARTLEQKRPLLGTLRVSRASFARTDFDEPDAAQSGQPALAIAPTRYADCAALSSALVGARAGGQAVHWSLPIPAN